MQNYCYLTGEEVFFFFFQKFSLFWRFKRSAYIFFLKYQCAIQQAAHEKHQREIGPLHDPVTWYKITHAGAQVAQWDFQNNATRTSPPGPAFVLEVPLRNLRTSMCDFVPCDRIVQRAYCLDMQSGSPNYNYNNSLCRLKT